MHPDTAPPPPPAEDPLFATPELTALEAMVRFGLAAPQSTRGVTALDLDQFAVDLPEGRFRKPGIETLVTKGPIRRLLAATRSSSVA